MYPFGSLLSNLVAFGDFLRGEYDSESPPASCTMLLEYSRLWISLTNPPCAMPSGPF